MKSDHLCLAGALALFSGAAAVPFVTAKTPSPAAVMASAANEFLIALPADLRKKSTFAIDDQHRVRWFYVPLARKGVSLKEMTTPQRAAALAFLKTGISQPGYDKATQIIALEQVLAEIENNPVTRDSELYYLSIFGSPSQTGTWGWRFEGHHLSLNFMIVKGAMIATTPVFLGANPSEVRSGPKKGLRVLGAEEDRGRALARSLNDAQRKIAFVSDKAPGGILTRNESQAAPLSPPGLPVSALDATQTAALRELVNEYAALMPAALARERLAKIARFGWNKVHFAWAGGLNPGERHYYRISGPSFVVEYDNTQNNANHVHTVWRDFQGDFGRDLLREHLKAAHHQP